jgi:hypothetical protein
LRRIPGSLSSTYASCVQVAASSLFLVSSI